MDPHGSNVPAFLTKLWTLIEDPDTNELICWSASGNSFHVFDQGRFAKEVLPKYFKHNNMASFVRQLNMYGFRKVVNIEQGGLVKPEKDDTEFQHVYFIRGQEHLLENIKRKVTSMSTVKPEEIKVRSDDVSKILTDVQIMKGKQENLDSKLHNMKHENEALWREVASLRQKHTQQQKVVNKLIQFLISLVQSNRIIGVKRKIPLMLNDSSSAHSMPKYNRPYSLEPLQESSQLTTSTNFPAKNCYSSDNSTSSGPIISDITDLAQCNPSLAPSLNVERTSPLIHIKEEPPSPTTNPEIEEVSPDISGTEEPLSPSTFIDSILEDNETSAAQPPPEDRCLSVACLDNLIQAQQMSEVNCVISSLTSSTRPRALIGNDIYNHLDRIDSSLDNLQNLLSGQTFSMESSTLLDLFNPSLSAIDLSLPDVEGNLAAMQDLMGSEEQRSSESDTSALDAGKQVVQYSAPPLLMVDTNSSDIGDLPVLFELGDSPYFPSDDNLNLDATDDDPLFLLSSTNLSHTPDPPVS
ncbi:heat shock factor protein 1 isoform X2 [Scyliorhinus canicula]|uniref:heat shock factor protein 1 isoform X2 n=1 Tax=Scyliorhinus canicula TaxID=7830 RepID=UPI0018F60465|nr:heat shock factor protein 1 isoform X2 [Scyliorhinus canicula]